MTLFALLRRVPAPYLWGAALILALLLATGWLDHLFRRPEPPIRRSEVTETSREDAARDLQLRLQEERITHLQEQLQQSLVRKNDVDQRVVERIERYPVPVPGQSVVIREPAAALPAHPAAENATARVASAPTTPPPEGAPSTAEVRLPVEVITRTTETVDRSTSQAESRRNTAETDQENAAAQAHETERTHTEATRHERTEAGGGGGSDSGGKLAAGLTSGLKPFAAYDLAQAQLGPRFLGLGRLRAGLFVTGTGQGDLDGGPQVNYQPRRGRLFLGAGYALRQRTPLLLGGWRF